MNEKRYKSFVSVTNGNNNKVLFFAFIAPPIPFWSLSVYF